MSKGPHHTITGQPENIEAVLCYIGIWVTGLVFFIFNKYNPRIQYHALQSIVTFGVLFGLMAVPVVGLSLGPILWIIAFALWLILIVTAHHGQQFEVPFVGRWVKKHVGIK